jgi:hypothetical protein
VPVVAWARLTRGMQPEPGPASWSTTSTASRLKRSPRKSSSKVAGRWPARRRLLIRTRRAGALDLAEVGVRVNGVCPLAWTRMVQRHQAAQARVTRQRTPDLVAPLIMYLLSDRAEGITGQLIRFTGDQLHIMRQPGIKEPVLQRTAWTTDDIAAAFDSVLDGHLEPFGLRKQPPPRLRRPESAHRTD